MKKLIVSFAVLLLFLLIGGCAVDKLNLSMEKGTLEYPTLKQPGAL